MTLPINWSLYVIVDMGLLTDANFLAVAEAAVSGGATVLQLRAKNRSIDDQIGLIEQLLPLAHAYGVPLLVNDLVDVVLATGADGVHLGSTDLSVALARNSLPDSLIGYSPDALTDARAAIEAGANYLGVGPFAATLTKPDAGQPIHSSGLSVMVKAVAIPVIAIGGMNAHNAAEAITAGAAGVAVASAVICAANPAAAARELRSIIDESRSVQQASRVLTDEKAV